jgi:hypothetical protein
MNASTFKSAISGEQQYETNESKILITEKNNPTPLVTYMSDMDDHRSDIAQVSLSS